MRKRRLLVDIAFMAITLASCSFNGHGSDSSLDTQYLSLSTEEKDKSVSSGSSESLSTHVSSYQRPSSERPFPGFSFLSSTLSKSYYKVSVYQSNLIPGQTVYGNPRFDFYVTVEAGKPLYSNVEDREALERQCTPSYRPNGGAPSLEGFYSDVTCQHFINYEFFVVNSEMNVYYYCNG